MVSDDTFFLSQLDTAFESSYAYLASAMRSFLRGWYHDCHRPALVEIYGSIEA